MTLRRCSLSARRSRRGFSLVEVLIVVALIALLGTMLVSGTGVLSSTRMRKASTMILSSIRLGMTHANTTGAATRLVFDLEEQRVTLEETSEQMLRKVDEDGEDPSAGADPATELERAAREEAAQILEGPRPSPPKFRPLPKFNGGEEEGPGRPLGRDIRFVSVQTEHDAAARTEGRAYLYFWPGGGTEKAVIQLTRPGREEPISIVVSALTGKAKIISEAVDYESPGDEIDFGEREVEQ